MPVIHAIFAPNLCSCAITLVGGRGRFSYEGLRVKCISGFVTKGDVRLYQVLVPSEKDIGHNLMVAFDREAVYGYLRGKDV